MPQTIEEVFAAAGVSLFPTQSGELHTDCSCPDWANPCKHVAAVHYILGEQFDEDPFLLFVLRGRTQEQVMAALRAQRRVEAGAGALAETPAEYQAEAASPPLDTLLEQYWRWDESLEHFPLFMPAAVADAARAQTPGPARFRGPHFGVDAGASVYCRDQGGAGSWRYSAKSEQDDAHVTRHGSGLP